MTWYVSGGRLTLTAKGRQIKKKMKTERDMIDGAASPDPVSPVSSMFGRFSASFFAQSFSV